MGRRFTKDVDTGEIYLLPDEKQALKNIPSFLNETVEEREDISESYERNNSISDLQKQLRHKDRQLKKATRNKVVLDNNVLIASFVMLGIVIILSVIVAASIINNNKSLPTTLVSDSIVVVTSDESYNSANVSESEDDGHNPDNSEPIIEPNPALDNTPSKTQNQWDLWETFRSRAAQFFANAIFFLVGWTIGAFFFFKVLRWLRP